MVCRDSCTGISGSCSGSDSSSGSGRGGIGPPRGGVGEAEPPPICQRTRFSPSKSFEKKVV